MLWMVVGPRGNFKNKGIMSGTVAVIIARGGSKGIPNKNIVKFCGKPLLVWSIENAKKTRGISSVWVSSDSKKILKIAKDSGANTITRPKHLSKDSSMYLDERIYECAEVHSQHLVFFRTTSLRPSSLFGQPQCRPSF